MRCMLTGGGGAGRVSGAERGRTGRIERGGGAERSGAGPSERAVGGWEEGGGGEGCGGDCGGWW
jgi:hypothetical protein